MLMAYSGGIQTFYLRSGQTASGNTTTSLTTPSAFLGTYTGSTVTAEAGANVNYLSNTAGSSALSVQATGITTPGSSSRTHALCQYATDALAAQTIAAGNWTIAFSGQVAAASTNQRWAGIAGLYLVNGSTGAIRQTLQTLAVLGSSSRTSTSALSCFSSSVAVAQVAVTQGDYIVLEIGIQTTKATSGNWTGATVVARDSGSGALSADASTTNATNPTSRLVAPANLSFPFYQESAGGRILGGVASVTIGVSVTAAGSCSIGGTAERFGSVAAIGAGSATLSGVGSTSFGVSVLGTGQLVGGGVSDASFDVVEEQNEFNHEADGSLVLDGPGSVTIDIPAFASGGASVTGFGGLYATAVAAGSGGATLDGEAVQSVGILTGMFGGCSVSGSATVYGTVTNQSSIGEVSFGGIAAAACWPNYIGFAAGSVVVAGAASDHAILHGPAGLGDGLLSGIADSTYCPSHLFVASGGPSFDGSPFVFGTVAADSSGSISLGDFVSADHRPAHALVAFGQLSFVGEAADYADLIESATSGGNSLSCQSDATYRPFHVFAGTGSLLPSGSPILRVAVAEVSDGGHDLGGTGVVHVTVGAGATGGTSIAGNATQAVAVFDIWSGGHRLGGVGIAFGTINQSAAGGTAVAGTASVTVGCTVEGGGEFRLGGLSDRYVTGTFQTSGAFAADGFGQANGSTVVTGDGGAGLSGVSDSIMAFSLATGGAARLGGESQATVAVATAADGGFQIGGIALVDLSAGTLCLANGSAAFGGDATAHIAVGTSSHGPIGVSGDAEVEVRVTVRFLASGGHLISGIAGAALATHFAADGSLGLLGHSEMLLGCVAAVTGQLAIAGTSEATASMRWFGGGSIGLAGGTFMSLTLNHEVGGSLFFAGSLAYAQGYDAPVAICFSGQAICVGPGSVSAEVVFDADGAIAASGYAASGPGIDRDMNGGFAVGNYGGAFMFLETRGRQTIPGGEAPKTTPSTSTAATARSQRDRLRRMRIVPPSSGVVMSIPQPRR